MNWLVYHIASGHAFFSGVVLVILAAMTSISGSPLTKRIGVLFCLLGAIAIAVSATPLPYVYYGLAVAATLAWLSSATLKRWRTGTRVAVIVTWSLAAAAELPYHHSGMNTVAFSARSLKSTAWS